MPINWLDKSSLIEKLKPLAEEYRDTMYKIEVNIQKAKYIPQEEIEIIPPKKDTDA